MSERDLRLAEIHAAIPHRVPFLFIDEVVERDERRIICRKTLRGDEFFYQGYNPQFPITPGVLLCEAAMQAGALLLSGRFGEKSGVPVATRMNDVRFKRVVRLEFAYTLAPSENVAGLDPSGA